MPARTTAHTFSGKIVNVKIGTSGQRQFVIGDWTDRYPNQDDPTFLAAMAVADAYCDLTGFSTNTNNWVYGTHPSNATLLIFHQDMLDLELSRSKKLASQR